MKVMTVFGTRPECIKMAPVINELAKYRNTIKSVCCVTGQHRQMLDQILDLFEIVPDYDLNIMKRNQSLFDITNNILLEMKEILTSEEPDILLVQGDTTTSFAASLAAFYQRIKIGHIEAGLRTYDKYNPFPEEMNRKLTDCLADFLFAPTEIAKDNLLKEGVTKDKILVVGNTGIDALMMTARKFQNSENPCNLPSNINFSKKVILVTAHRRESFGEKFENICMALKTIADNFDVEIVYPVHLNPKVQEPVRRILGATRNVSLIEPLDYKCFVHLMSKSYLILTDSGGIQEEAPSLGKPVLVMRDVTERPEAINAGTAKLVGANKELIIQEVGRLLENSSEYEKMSKIHNPYGDGKASKRIINLIRREVEENYA